MSVKIATEKMQVRPAGQAGYPISLVASLDTVPVKCRVPLHYYDYYRKGRGKKKEKERSFTSIEKSGHKRRANDQNSAGGEKGTNGPPEPTYTAKRT